MELSTKRSKLVLGDCLNAMKALEADSIDTIITDPPYGLGFMGKMWDHGVPGVPFWETALRVAKPGAMLLAFGGTRTSHRLTCAIEDAGWEIRDSIIWLYATGFPKSHNISKALDKAAGKEREVVGQYQPPDMDKPWNLHNAKDERMVPLSASSRNNLNVTAPATDISKTWEGWGTALSPSHEPIILAMKPRDGTFANNALTWDCAGLNIDGGRIPAGEVAKEGGTENAHPGQGIYGDFAGNVRRTKGGGANSAQGRWPKNTILSHHPDCAERGVRRVRSGKAHRTKSGGNTFGGDNPKPSMGDMTYAGPDGLETVTNWDCHPDCPVRMLAEQSGERKSGGANGLRQPTGRNDWRMGANHAHYQTGIAPGTGTQPDSSTAPKPRVVSVTWAWRERAKRSMTGDKPQLTMPIKGARH